MARGQVLLCPIIRATCISIESRLILTIDPPGSCEERSIRGLEIRSFLASHAVLNDLPPVPSSVDSNPQIGVFLTNILLTPPAVPGWFTLLIELKGEVTRELVDSSGHRPAPWPRTEPLPYRG